MKSLSWPLIPRVFLSSPTASKTRGSLFQSLGNTSWSVSQFGFFSVYHLGRRKAIPEVLDQDQQVHEIALAEPPPLIPTPL